MTLHRAVRVSAKLLTLVAFTALVGTGKAPMPLAIGGFLALAMSFVQESAWGSWWCLRQLPRSVWNGALVMALLAAAADFLWGTQQILQAGLYVLVFLMANKLLTLSRLKDVPQLFVIGFLEFLSAAVLTVDLWYAMAFVVYLLTAVWALLAYHLSCEAVQSMAVADEARLALMPVPLTARFFWTTNAIAIAALVVTSGIFLVMPRTGFGFFHQANGTPIRTSGFSEKVDLGVIGAVKLDATLVMRVQFPELEGEPAERMYLKGASFDHYTGQSWTNTFSRRQLHAKTEDGLFEVGAGRVAGNVMAMDRHARRVNQDVLLEALDISVLFGLAFVSEVRGPFTSLETDGMGGLWLPHALPGRLQYAITSMPTSLSNEDRQGDVSDYPTELTRRFLQLPSIDPKVADLAHAVTRDIATPYGMTIAIKQHLLAHYAYSLDVGSTPSASPLEEFLFTRQTGYCEHYATAMAVMLRTVGIPARLVTGFLPGEWNDFGHYYAVRQQDAHAWVEVWFPHSGWVTFDPTPSIVKPFPSPLLKQVRGLIDSIRLKWDRFVIHYSFYDQMTVAQGMRNQGERVRAYIGNIMDTLKSWSGSRREPGTMGISLSPWISFGAILLCMTCLLFIGVLWKTRTAKAAFEKRDMAAVHLYERMLAALAAHGVSKQPCATPLEFSARVCREFHAAGPLVQELTALYYRVRFGHELLSQYDLQQAEELLTRLTCVPVRN
jgi:Transglutaminase-like enzymes, putative cysteine proteases